MIDSSANRNPAPETTPSKMDIFLIDAIGPFFRNYRKHNINWSKIPFTRFEKDPAERQRLFASIRADLDVFADRVRKIGFNSVSLDDVAHLIPDPWLEPWVNASISACQKEYHALFSILRRHGLQIYLTIDVLSLSPGLKASIGGSRARAGQFLVRQFHSLFQTFPEVRGVIVRIGECDGKDVQGQFKSELLLRTSRQVNGLLKKLLPVFDHYGRQLILRTWTVGSYPIGDFIWHRDTTARVLRGIDNPNFILSMKYGESDFFRYLPLNKHFFRLKVKKIVELQARREYEGCGEYPSFIGWDYEKYAQQLAGADNMVGICVWCQTGGWGPFRRLSFLEPAALWNELNSYVTLKIFRYDWSVERAVEAFAIERGYTNSQGFLELLRLDDEVIKELLYIKEFASQKLFFRRVRIPPLLYVFWNNIFINHSVRKVLRYLVQDGEQSVSSGYQALEKIERMKALAMDLQLPADDIQFMADTFALLALAREYYFLPYTEEIKLRLKNAKKQYKSQYPKSCRPRYRVKTDFSPFVLRTRHLGWLLRISLRSKRGYRVLDYLLTLHLLTMIYFLITRAKPDLIPSFARKSAMGIGAIFR